MVGRSWLVASLVLVAGCDLYFRSGPPDAAAFDAPFAPDATVTILDGPPPDAAGSVAVCNGSAVDEDIDPRNCGACGHGCLGGACSGGFCQPVTLAISDAPQLI